MSKVFTDQIPPEGGRKYSIAANPDGTSSITDVTQYVQDGTPWGAGDANEVSEHIADTDIHTTPQQKVLTLTHSRSGTVHTLAGLPTAPGIYTAQFAAAADYAEGDTWADGYVAKPMGEDTDLPDRAFVAGDLVSVVVDTANKRLGFSLGGGGSSALASDVTITVVGSLPVGVGGTRVVVRNERLGLYLSIPLDANHKAKFQLLSGLKYGVYLENYPEGYYGGSVTVFPQGESVEETIDMLTQPDIVGVYVNQTAKTLTYLDGAVGFAPAKMGPGGWEWGGWVNHWLVTETRPCVLKGGVVQYYLDPDNYAKKRDGTPANITGDDGDVMVEFPLTYVKIYTDTTGYGLRFSRTKIDETWTANAFLNRDGVPMPYIYLAAYDGAILDGKLRSLSGLAPTVSQTIAAFRTQANANGLGYEQQQWMQRSYLQMLFLLLTKATDSQGVVGKGVTSASAAIPAGTMNAKGLCWGDQTGTNGVKFMGIENPWGNTWKFCDGFINNAGTARIKLFAPYNDAGTGYTNEGSIPTTPNYIDKISPTPSKGLMPSSLIADEPTSFYRDQMYTTSTGVNICYTGGSWSGGAAAGVFYVIVYHAASYSDAGLSAALSFTPQ